MGRIQYLELYKKFLENRISEAEYKELMEWVQQSENTGQLRKYMEKYWELEDLTVEERGINWEKFVSKVEGKDDDREVQSKKSLMPKIWYYAAASLVILISIGYGLSQFTGTDIVEYRTGFGETQNIVLEDGSTVILNANSTLSWNGSWEREEIRNVELKGEAFFDVVHLEEDIAFEVKTNELKIKVLGTSFNVNSRRDVTDVFLQSGKIELNLDRQEENILSMVPGDRVDYSKKSNTLVKEKVEEIDESIDWVNGVLRFEEVKVDEMFKKMEDLYGKKFIIDDKKLLSRKMFAGIPFEDWEVALEAVELSLGVKFEENEKNELRIKSE
ncbi:FecR family protein [Membranihabitans maritimus]|uniref:FecR family protein n=1 Tax=Membranihabitans maritimus TaxID=2904244 RepID=UPI001F472727